MTPAPASPKEASRWSGPDADGPSWRERLRAITWSKVLWTYLFPRSRQQIRPTVSGVLLISVALGIGSAAYNTSNNILFITLSLLLACLVLSGVLSQINLTRVSWRLMAKGPFRVGQSSALGIEIRNAKKLLPTYGLWFELQTEGEAEPQRLLLRERLDPGGLSTRLDTTWQPPRRGRLRVELGAVGSLFPFGFLRKTLFSGTREEILVWPAAIDYQRLGRAAAMRRPGGHAARRLGHSGDLLALRRYEQGDSHRLIHWKASARLRHLMVRQFSSEQQETYSLHVDSSAELWPDEEQFELLCSFAATLAEDLFTHAQLGSVAIDHEAPRVVRSVRDLEAFFDDLAELNPREPSGRPSAAPWPSAGLDSGLTFNFAPEGRRGVAAYLNGEKAAAA